MTWNEVTYHMFIWATVCIMISMRAAFKGHLLNSCTKQNLDRRKKEVFRLVASRLTCQLEQVSLQHNTLKSLSCELVSLLLNNRHFWLKIYLCDSGGNVNRGRNVSFLTLTLQEVTATGDRIKHTATLNKYTDLCGFLSTLLVTLWTTWSTKLNKISNKALVFFNTQKLRIVCLSPCE